MEVAYVWVVDAVSTVFVNREELDDVWAAAQGFVRAHPGLVTPAGLSMDMGNGVTTRTLSNTGSQIQVQDVDGTLASIFAGGIADAESLVLTLEAGATAPAATYSKHVGYEAIGPAGERRRYSCVPGFAIGMRHYGQNEAYALGVARTPVTDGPAMWAGRWCAVYRVKLVDGVWQSLADAKRVWWGTMPGRGKMRGRSWSWSCPGPEAWLQGTLGRGIFEQPLRAIPALSFSTDGAVGEHKMLGALDLVLLDDLSIVVYTYVDANTVDDTSLVGATSYSDVVTAVDDFLGVLAADATGVAGVAFEDAQLGENSPSSDLFYATEDGQDGIHVRWIEAADNQAVGADTMVARLTLVMHEKAWSTLGYDPRTQTSARDPVQNPEQYGQFRPTPGAPGYFQGTFYSANAEAMGAFESGDFTGIYEHDCTNNHQPRRWPPIYPGGAVSFTGQARQEFQLQTYEPLYWEGQNSRPPLDDSEDDTSPYTISKSVGEADRQGIMVFEGPYRARGDDEQVDPLQGAFQVEKERREGKTVQVARVGWHRNSDGSIKFDSEGLPRLVIYQWLNPKLFGFDYDRFKGSWGSWRKPPPGAEGTVARPLTVFEYTDGAELAVSVVQRVLATTGTVGGWYTDAGLTTPAYGSTGASLYVDVGDNDTGGALPKDAEFADLGLGIPASMIADPADWYSAQAQVGPHLRRCKAAFYGSLSARELIGRVLAPLGLAIGLAGGKYGAVDVWGMPSPSEAVRVLTREDYGGKTGDPRSAMAKQGERSVWPIDLVTYTGRVEPVDGSYHVKGERKATDAGAAYRAQTNKHDIKGDHLIDPSVAIAGNSWEGDLFARLRQLFDFYGREHMIVEIAVHADIGVDLYPGSVVVLTDPWIADPSGEYGVSLAVGRVLSRTLRASAGKVSLKILLSAETDTKLYGPSAVVRRYDEDDEGMGYRLLCDSDHFEMRNGQSTDVDGFEEPNFSSEGGNADIEIFQYDGVGWTRGIFGTVASVNGETGNAYITLTGALTGNTYYRDMHHVVVMRPWASQGAAWVKRWLAPICESDGTHSGGTPGSKFRGV